MESQINKKINIMLSIWVVLLFTWVGGVAYITDRIEQSYQDSIYYYKVMNAPLRSFHPSVYQDSISRAKQERKMEKLLKEIRK